MTAAAGRNGDSGGGAALHCVVFLRHNNDVDHVVPVVWKLASTTAVRSHLVTIRPELASHPRVAIVASMPGVEVCGLDAFAGPDFCDWRRRYERWRARREAVSALPRIAPRRIWRKAKAALGIDRDEPPPRPELLDAGFGERLLAALIPPGAAGVVCFDWVMSTSVDVLPVARNVVPAAKARGLPTVCLPHGDSPHQNDMIWCTCYDYGIREIYRPSEMFDAVVVPNELCARRYRPFLARDRIRVLGSPRYSAEWVEKLRELRPAEDTTLPRGSLNCVMFLRGPQYPVFWDEVMHTFRLLLRFEGVELLVKDHPREPCMAPLLGRPEWADVAGHRRFHLDRGLPSDVLVDWADVVLDLATSVSFEAVRLGKPVLAMEHLQACRSTLAAYIPECAMRCRDDVHDTIARLLAEGCGGFYRSEGRAAFLREMLDGPDGAVLERYAGLLTEKLGEAGSGHVAS